jgi:hypothetical protein
MSDTKRPPTRAKRSTEHQFYRFLRLWRPPSGVKMTELRGWPPTRVAKSIGSSWAAVAPGPMSSFQRWKQTMGTLRDDAYTSVCGYRRFVPSPRDPQD